jgi:hypothetical protein
MYQVNITLPTIQHNGTSNLAIIQGIEQTIAQQFGGYSSHAIRGGWIDKATGVLVEEYSTVIYTFVHTPAGIDSIREQAQQWAKDLKQIELLITAHEVDVTFVQGTREQAPAA